MNNEIILHPKYVVDFQCDGSKCNSKCCRNNWRIDIDVDTYKKYQRIKNPVMRKKILSSIQPLTASNGISPLRSVANHAALSVEAVEEAKRVARSRVVMKEANGSEEFGRLGFKKIMGGKYSKVHYGVMDL